MIPDYGLEDLAPGDDEEYGEGFNDETTFGDEDTFNDDTFGDAGEWRQGNESALEMSKLHEQFLSGDYTMPQTAQAETYEPGQEAGGFFGDMLEGAGGADFLLEDDPSLDALGPSLDDDALDMPLSLDAHTEQLLESPSRHQVAAQRAPPPATTSNRGLRVGGLPRTLDETQTKQLLTHFGPLKHFELQRGAVSNTATLSYQDASITETACASLHGIPLGTR